MGEVHPVSGAEGAEKGSNARTALILVSHSMKLADGTQELAAQMAPNVLIVAVGGLADGSIGTDFDRTTETLNEMGHQAEGVVVLADLGSAVLTVESVLEFADDDLAARTRLADAPFVEGAIAAAVAANGGGDVEAVLSAAEQAGSTFASAPEPVAIRTPNAPTAPVTTSDTARKVEVANPLGLHARPAAELSRLAASFDARVTINGVNAASVLELMKLNVVGGQMLDVDAQGAQAQEAVAAVVEAINGGFGEA